jgi:hypothetical protein
LFVASRSPDTKTRFATGSSHDGELNFSNHVVRKKSRIHPLEHQRRVGAAEAE